MAVNYSAGRENIGSLYGNLRQAIANKGAAENAARQRDIDRKGLFGSGISASDLKGMSDVGLGIAEFGQGRMDKQMANAEKSFGRRQAADERRLATLQKRADLGDKNALGEMRGIQMSMSERRNAFEDKMGEYSGKGIWGTGFGSDEVGWRTKDKGAVGPESDFSRRMRGTPQTGGREAGAGPWDPGVGGSDSGGTALGSGPGPGASGGGRARPIRQAGSMGPGEEWSPGAGGSGSGGTALGTGSGPGASGRGGGRGSWDPGAGGGGFGGSTMGSGPRPGEGFLSSLGKKKDELGGGQVGTRANPEDTAHMRSRSEFSSPGSIGANPEDTAHMRSRSEFSQPESNKFEEKPSDMRMPGVLRNLTKNQRTRMDRLGRQRIEREDLAPLNAARAEYDNQIQDTLKKRRNKKLSDLVAGLNLG